MKVIFVFDAVELRFKSTEIAMSIIPDVEYSQSRFQFMNYLQ